MENIITHDYLRKVIAKRIQLVAKNDLQHLINSEPLFQERICCGAMLLRIFDGKEVNQDINFSKKWRRTVSFCCRRLSVSAELETAFNAWALSS